MTIIANALDEGSYVDALYALEGCAPHVDVEARWGITVAGARALHVMVDAESFGPRPARWMPYRNVDGGRWCEVAS